MTIDRFYPKRPRAFSLWLLLAFVVSLAPLSTWATVPPVPGQSLLPQGGAVSAPVLAADALQPSGSQTGAKPLIFSDDFEAFGDSSRWNRNLPFTVQREVVSDGNHAARLTSSGGDPVYGRERLEIAHPVVYIRLDFRVLEGDPRPFTLLHLRAADMSSIVAVELNPDGAVSFRTGPTEISSTSTPGTTSAEWNRLQIMVDTTRTEHNLRIWLNEAELTTMRQDAWLGEEGIRVFEVGDNTAGRSYDIAVDNVLVDETFIPANRTADPVSGTLVVRTSIGWEGVIFELDGRRFTSDAQGVVRIEVERWSTDLRNRIIVHDATLDTYKATFSGWHDWLSPHSREVFAAFNLWQPITFTFVDMFDAPVDPAMIDQVIIKSSFGELYIFETSDLDGPVLMISSMATSPLGLHSKPITYYVDQILIDGANVVNRSQQRTTFDASQQWQISLLFFGVRFQALDALFGTPLGEELVVRAPDGTEHRLPLDSDGYATIPRLPRGDYEVSVVGGGYSPPRPIRISRDQVVQLEVISQRDGMVLGGVIFTVVASLVLAGRPFIVTTPFRFVIHTVGTIPRRLESRGQP